MTRKFWLLMLVVLMIAACGGDDDNGEPADIQQSTEPAPVEVSNPVDATIEPRDYVLGPEDAFVTVIMYGDFQCGRCARYARDLEILRGEYPNDLRIIWRHLPDTTTNDKAALTLQASEAAAAQGRFWDMHAVLFTTLAEWVNLPEEEFRPALSEYAEVAGLDIGAFNTALAEEVYAPLVEAYQEQADALGIVGIPTLLINGEPLNDRDDLFGLRGAIELALLAREHFEQSPPLTIDRTLDYQAVIETEKGDIRIDLYEDDSPFAVNNFVFLVEQGWYDETTFHLVIPGFYAQAGDPSGTGRGNPGYFIPGEHDNGFVFDRAGLVALSHPPGELERNGSQFFITYDALPERDTEWDGQYTIFGEVVDGLDVLEELTPRNPGDPIAFPNPEPGDRIRTIRIETE
jgi:cyclophilin family peptidyl-prolyl cis-trans isomerase/protein-disulfide isomerase